MSETIPLGEVVDVSAGQPAPKPNEFSDYGYPFIRAGSLESLLKGSSENDCEKVCSKIAQNRRLKLFPKDTVIFAKSGMSAKIGRVYRLRQPSYVVSHLATLTPTGKYDSSFLMHWLKQHPPSHLINDNAYPSIRVSEIAGLKVPNLPIYKQRRIATILDTVDTILQKCEQSLSFADDLFKFTFLDMFLGKNSDWPKVPLKSVAELINGDRSRNYPSGNDIVGKGIIFLSTKNIDGSRLVFDTTEFITPEKFSTLSRGKLQRNDLVITLRGSIGQCAIFDSVYETGFINAQMMIIRPSSEVLPKYLHGLIVHPFVQNKLISIKSGSAIPQLTAKQIGELDIPLPPIAMQREFSIFVEKVERMEKHLRKNITQASDLFASLSHRAFRGELQGVVCD